jgi:hypothetical protein
MEFAGAASGFTRLTLAVVESGGILVVSLAIAVSLAASFGIGRLVERASRDGRRPAVGSRSTRDL